MTRLTCGKLGLDLPAELRENELIDARAAGQMRSRPLSVLLVKINECP
jgi:hypothetical protein